MSRLQPGTAVIHHGPSKPGLDGVCLTEEGERAKRDFEMWRWEHEKRHHRPSLWAVTADSTPMGSVNTYLEISQESGCGF